MSGISEKIFKLSRTLKIELKLFSSCRLWFYFVRIFGFEKSVVFVYLTEEFGLYMIWYFSAASLVVEISGPFFVT